MPSIFTRIITREIPGQIIAEDANYIALLDINPLVQGHTLVVPKKEVDYIFDLDAETLAGLHLFTQKVAVALGKVIPCERVGVVVAGLEVPHAHVHLIPFRTMDDMNFNRPKLKFSKEEFTAIADKIRSAL